MKRIIYSLVVKFDLKYDLTRRHKSQQLQTINTSALIVNTSRKNNNQKNKNCFDIDRRSFNVM